MITLLRWAFWLCALIAIGYFAATVPLGSRTLVQHLRAIASTPEAKELGAGARDEAAKMAERVRQGLTGDASTPPPVEHLDDADRKALDRAVRDHTGPRTPAH